MHHASKCLLVCLAWGHAIAMASAEIPAASCNKPVYLTFDTGHMEVAPLDAEVLQRQQERASFFLSN